MTLGEAIKKRLAVLGISGNKATRVLDVSRQTFAMWERDAQHPRPEQWEKVADFLAVSRVDVAVMLGAISEAELKARCADETKGPKVLSGGRPAKIPA